MKNALTHASVVRMSEGQVWQDLNGEHVILNLRAGTYYGLDPVGSRVWNLIQQPIMVGEIKETLVREYDVEPERCERDLMALLGELTRAGLVELAAQPR